MLQPTALPLWPSYCAEVQSDMRFALVLLGLLAALSIAEAGLPQIPGVKLVKNLLHRKKEDHHHHLPELPHSEDEFHHPAHPVVAEKIADAIVPEAGTWTEKRQR